MVSVSPPSRSGWPDVPGPVPPENVRFVVADGRELPVDCVYVGSRAGIDHWRVATPFAGKVQAVRVGVWPAQASIDFGSVEPS